MDKNNNTITVSSKAELIENEKVKQQKESASKIEERQKEAAAKAESAALSSRLDDLVRKAKEEEKRANAADRKSTRLNSSHRCTSRMPSSA